MIASYGERESDIASSVQPGQSSQDLFSSHKGILVEVLASATAAAEQDSLSQSREVTKARQLIEQFLPILVRGSSSSTSSSSSLALDVFRESGNGAVLYAKVVRPSEVVNLLLAGDQQAAAGTRTGENLVCSFLEHLFFSESWQDTTLATDLLVRYLEQRDIARFSQLAAKIAQFDGVAVLQKLDAVMENTKKEESLEKALAMQRIALLRKLGRHREALEALVKNSLLLEAELYCLSSEDQDDFLISVKSSAGGAGGGPPGPPGGGPPGARISSSSSRASRAAASSSPGSGATAARGLAFGPAGSSRVHTFATSTSTDPTSTPSTRQQKVLLELLFEILLENAAHLLPTTVSSSLLEPAANPPPEEEDLLPVLPLPAPLLAFLEQYFAFLSPELVLSKLPDSTPVGLLDTYLRLTHLHTTHFRRSNQLESQLVASDML